jgi:N-glycosylase/DNA lyase
MAMTNLPEPWRSTFDERREAIRSRLADFSRVPASQYFYELAFCILTPQSSARNAEKVIVTLTRDRFFETGFDPTSYLRNADHYIRFHNTKAKRLLDVRSKFAELLPILEDSSIAAKEKREIVISKVNGLGMKESSHFLRNIGVRDLAILDRHIFKHLHRLGVIESIPTSGPTKKQYLEIEERWKKFSRQVQIPMDELDLLFWSMETGEIRK